MNRENNNQDSRTGTFITIAVFALLLLTLNIPRGGKSPAAYWTFHPASIIAGEWWRLLTGPFVHVGTYHLLLDGAAFLSLYAMPERR